MDLFFLDFVDFEEEEDGVVLVLIAWSLSGIVEGELDVDVDVVFPPFFVLVVELEVPDDGDFVAVDVAGIVGVVGETIVDFSDFVFLLDVDLID